MLYNIIIEEYIDNCAYKEITEFPIVIDFSECKTWDELHNLLNVVFKIMS